MYRTLRISLRFSVKLIAAAQLVWTLIALQSTVTAYFNEYAFNDPTTRRIFGISMSFTLGLSAMMCYNLYTAVTKSSVLRCKIWLIFSAFNVVAGFLALLASGFNGHISPRHFLPTVASLFVQAFMVGIVFKFKSKLEGHRVSAVSLPVY